MTLPLNLYTHDCTRCFFLGSTVANNCWMDLYYHPNKSYSGTIIARYGNSGSEYTSCVIELITIEMAELFIGTTMAWQDERVVAYEKRFVKKEREHVQINS